MNKPKTYRIILRILLLVLVLFACAGCGRVLDSRVAVMVAGGEGYTVTGENPRYVFAGEEVIFALQLEEGYTLVAAEGADVQDGALVIDRALYPVTVIPDVRKNAETYTLTLAEYTGRGAIHTTSAPGEVFEGTSVTVQAQPHEGYVFGGWYSEDRTQLLSSETQYTFVMEEDTALVAFFCTPEVLESRRSKVTLIYHANGGECTLDGALDGVWQETIALQSFRLANCQPDLGQFVRPGYHLIEYNTRADGKGQGYSLGSKILTYTGIEKKESEHLYCIWKKETDPALFDYTEKNGELTVTGYRGDEAELIIPAYIEGKPVVSLAQGAIRDKKFTVLSLPKTMRSVQKEALIDCPNFFRVYFPDLIETIPDDAFVGCENFSDFYLNAVTMPRRGDTRSKKFETVATTQDLNRVIVVSGSSSIAGLDSGLIGAALDDRYFVANYGTSGASCGMFYLEMISHFVHEGDVIVHAPEYTESQMGRNMITWINFRDTESYYNFFRYVDMRNYYGLFSAFTESQRTRLPVAERRYNVPITGIDLHGDRTGSYPGLNTPDFTSHLNIAYDPNGYPDQWLENLAWAHKKCMDAGAQVYFTFAPHNHNGLTESGRTEENKRAFTAKMDEYFDAPVIGYLGDYTLEGQYFWDTDWHPNDEGRRLHSTQMAKDIRAQMEKEGRLP